MTDTLLFLFFVLKVINFLLCFVFFIRFTYISYIEKGKKIAEKRR